MTGASAAAGTGRGSGSIERETGTVSAGRSSAGIAAMSTVIANTIAAAALRLVFGYACMSESRVAGRAISRGRGRLAPFSLPAREFRSAMSRRRLVRRLEVSELAEPLMRKSTVDRRPGRFAGVIYHETIISK